MVKKFNNLKWESFGIEGFPMTDNLQGFIGLEECTDYGLEKDRKSPKKTKPKKRKNPISEEAEQNNNDKIAKVQNKVKMNEIQHKKVKLSNGFIVEPCLNVTPSSTNDELKNKSSISSNSIVDINGKKTKFSSQEPKKNTKPKLGEVTAEVKECLTPEDMLSWAEFKLQEPIVNALAELGFKQPTNIQQLTLPAAIHGRRDILGAAETGSGKTLAFGLPILSGILKLKEKADAGLDVYSIPYKKTSIKRKPRLEKTQPKKNNTKKKNCRKKAKDSFEAEYASDEDEDSDSNSADNDDNVTNKDSNEINNFSSDVENKPKEDFIEEIEIPFKKRIEVDDDDSDDSPNFVHLSEMPDYDDLADSSGDEKVDECALTENKSDDDELSNDDIDGNDDVDENNEGLGCVKVIDDVEIPGHVVTKTGKPLYALILTPTRELAIQISRHLIAAAKYTGIRVATIVGGMAAVKQERILRCGPEVVVGTPGRLWELHSQGQPHLQQLHTVKFLAIDETDRMVERNHFEELQPLLERLNADDAQRNTRQNFVFSATLTMVHDLPVHMRGKKVTKRGKIINRKIEKMTPQQKIKRLINMIGMTDPKVVDITTQNLGTAETLTECRITCSIEHKDAYLYYILKRHPGRTIVFCNSIGCVKRLTQLFSMLNCRPLPLHATMPQRQRLKNLERFRDDPQGVLVSTDVAARGLDIPDIDHVVHYQVPRTAENYVHRSGRTARANKEGLTILMMEPAEAYLYAKMCRTLNKTAELPTFPVSPISLTPIKELVKVAQELDSLTLRKRRTMQAQGWREKVAKELDIVVDEDNVPSTNVDPSIDKALRNKRKQLEAMLSRPIFPRGFSFKYPTLNDPEALSIPEENALQVMKKAMQSGSVKKEKRKGKNAELLNLAKTFKRK